jgi:hypothetical protein
MKRFAEKTLQGWIKKNNRKPLVIRGARQVGKTSLVRMFAKEQGLTLYEINLERHPLMSDLFKTFDTNKILQEIQFICKKGPIKKNSLLFFDEIQAIPVAIQSLRYFYEDLPELPVVAAGSLLEFALSKHNFSMPVGRIEYLFLHPVCFEEMLVALDETLLLKLIKEWTPNKTFPLSAHQRLLELLRIFLVVGGMPEALSIYIKNNDFQDSFDIQTLINETYKDDFSKYSSQTDLLRLHKIFDYVPIAIGEKFKYVRVDPDEQARVLSNALDMLVKAQIINCAFHTDASGLPLKASINRRIFKPYFLDCGLMNNICGINWISPEQLSNADFINKGKIAEQFIAQHLSGMSKNNQKTVLTYWLREGRSSNAELDFVSQFNQAIVPMEIKAGKSGSLKSLQQFVLEKKISFAIRFDMNPPSFQHVSHNLNQKKVEFDLLSLPLYMVGQWQRIFSVFGGGLC